jgi:hypothetical protein
MSVRKQLITTIKEKNNEFQGKKKKLKKNKNYNLI